MDVHLSRHWTEHMFRLIIPSPTGSAREWHCRCQWLRCATGCVFVYIVACTTWLSDDADRCSSLPVVSPARLFIHSENIDIECRRMTLTAAPSPSPFACSFFMTSSLKPLFFSNFSVSQFSAAPAQWQRRQEETYATNIQRTANIRFGENVRTNQISGWTRTG